jgi:hypothetical protein
MRSRGIELRMPTVVENFYIIRIILITNDHEVGLRAVFTVFTGFSVLDKFTQLGLSGELLKIP